WALDNWRGGIGGTCCFDEQIHPAVLEALARRERADAVVCVPAAAALIDPTIVEAMVEHYRRIADSMRMTFSQAPPGLAPAILATQLLAQLRENRAVPGFALAYRPDQPQADMIAKDCCYKVPAEIIHTAGRFLADCDRGVERIAALLGELDGQDDQLTASAICRWQRERQRGYVEPLPREVEIELTTEDQLPETTLRPRGSAVGKRGPIRLDLIDRLAGELGRLDDSLVVVGGFGEPLLHPALAEILGRLRQAGIYGLGLRTNGIGLDAAAIEAICQARVDVVTVLLDAATAETYRRVHGGDYFDQVQANIEALVKARQDRSQAAPLIVPEMTKARDSLGDMEAFFDGWIRRLGWAVIDGYSHYAGQRPDRSVLKMAPPHRWACRRIFARCMVLADGRVLCCDRDFTGSHAVGSLWRDSLAELWHGRAMQHLRTSHLQGRYDGLGLCGSCTDWHRP
ncbi:MAG: radical SAM protein, partial [Phycisphaerae bacterium]